MLERRQLPSTPFTTDDLPELGISRQKLRDAITAGVVRRVLTGVFVSADVPDTHDIRVGAACLVIAPGHVARDRTAAWLYGIDAFNYGEHDVLPPVEACVAPGKQPSQRLGVDGRIRDLRPGDITRLDGGVLVTTPLRTALDLGGLLKRRTAFATLCAFSRTFGITCGQMTRELPRFRRRRGVIQLRQLVAIVEPRLESPREAWVWLAISDAGLPLPEPQFWIQIADEMCRLDFVYESQRIVIEYDGREWHDRTAEQRERDDRRRRWLRSRGWVVIVITSEGFAPEGERMWLDELRASLRRRSTSMRWSPRNDRTDWVNLPKLATHVTKPGESANQTWRVNEPGGASVRRP